MMDENAIVVKSFDEAGALIAFDPQSGRFRELGSDSEEGQTSRGIAHIQDGTLGAVYADGGRLMLQLGTRRWRLGDPLVRLELSRSDDRMVNTFRVNVAGRNEAEMTYRSPRADPINQADPSFDALDEELQDFFLWVARNSKDPGWIADLARNWSARALN